MPYSNRAISFFLLMLAGFSVQAAVLAPPPASVCTDVSAAGVGPGAALTPGRWQDAALPGVGWDFHYSQDGQSVIATWYSFSVEGRPIWYTTRTRQWTVTGWPVGAPSWDSPLLKVSLTADGQRRESEVGEVAFTRLLNDPQRLAIRWQWSGQTTSHDSCVIDAAGAGFGQAETAIGPTGVWQGTGDDAYRLHWNAVLADLGAGPVEVERAQVLTFDSAREPVWLLGQRIVTPLQSAPAQQLSLAYPRSLYAGGHPTQQAAARCRAAASGCYATAEGSGVLSREYHNNELSASLAIEGSFSITNQALSLNRSDVTMQREVLATTVALDRDWCHVTAEVPHCTVTLAVGSDQGQVYRVDNQSGQRTLLQHTVGEPLVDQVPVGSYKYGWQPVGIAVGGAAILAETWPLTILPPPDHEAPSASVCNTHVPSGPDACEVDNQVSDYKHYYGLTEYHHNFHSQNDVDIKSFSVPGAGFVGFIRFVPESPGMDQWHYEIRRGNGLPLNPPVSGLVGALQHQTIRTNPATAELGGNLFVSVFTPGSSGLINQASRYVVSKSHGYFPPNDGPDTYEIDNTYAQARPLAHGQVHQKNFHTTNELDWISLDVNPGDQQTLTFEPVIPSSFGGGAPWTFEIHRLEPNGTLTALTALDGGFQTGAVTRLIAHPGGSEAFTYFVLVRPTIPNFHGNASRYNVGLTVVSSPQPDEYEAGAGDNTRQTATPLSPGLQQLHNFHTGSDRDWMSYTPAATNTTVSFNIAPQVVQSTAPKFVAQLWTLNELGVPIQIAEAEGGYANFGYPGVTLAQVSTRASQPYWLEMYSNDGSFVGNPSTYGVTLTTAAGYPTDDYEPDDTESAAQLIPANQDQLHSFHHVGDQDWYKIPVGPNQTATFTLTPTTNNGSNPWSWQSYRDIGSGASALASGNFGSAAGVVSVAHSGGATGQWAYLRVYRNPAVSGFQGDPSRYTAKVALSGVLQPPSCTLSDWSNTVGTPVAGSSAHSPPIRSYYGTCGVEMSAIGSYLVDQQPAAESTYNARFYYYTGDRSGGIADIFQARSGAGFNLIRVRHDGNALSFNVNGSGTTRSVTVVDNKWYSVQLQWRAAASGSLGIQVTGNNSDTSLPVSPITGFNNAADRIEEVRLGLISGTGTGTAVGFDEYQARRINAPKRHCRGDAVPDGVRNQLDIDAINAQIANQALALGQADMNEDGVVNQADIDALQPFINTTCP